MFIDTRFSHKLHFERRSRGGGKFVLIILTLMFEGFEVSICVLKCKSI